MKRAILLLIVLGCLPASSSSSWLLIPLDETVQNSDLIVVGALNAVFEHSNKGIDYGEGTITIEEVIWGQATSGEPLLLKWQNASQIVCPRIEHRYKENKIGIWLLTIEEDGTVRANHPARFVELSQKADVNRFLHEKKVCLRANQYRVNTSEPINVSVGFRNPTQTQIQFPGLEYRNGHLFLSPEIELAINSGWGQRAERVGFLASRVFVSEDLAPITVEPGQEQRIVIDLRELFEVVLKKSYTLNVKVKGFGQGNPLPFYTSPPDPEDTFDIPREETTAAIRQNRSTLGLTMLSTIGVAGFLLSLFVYRRGRTDR